MFCCANTKRDFCKVFLPQIPDAFWALIWHLAFWKKRLQSYHHSTVWSSLKINRLWCNFRLKNTVKCIYFSFEFLHNYRSHPMQKKPTFKNRKLIRKKVLFGQRFLCLFQSCERSELYLNFAPGATESEVTYIIQSGEIRVNSKVKVQMFLGAFWGSIFLKM